MLIRTIFTYRHSVYSGVRLSGCLESGTSMTQAARGLPAALHEPPPLALAPRPGCSAGDGNGATGITATGDASPLSRRAAAPRASSRTMLTTQRRQRVFRAAVPPCRIGLTSRLASSGRRCHPLDSAPTGGIARAQKTILMAFSDQGGSAEIPAERAAGQVSKPDSVPARCIRTQGSNARFGADGTFPGPP